MGIDSRHQRRQARLLLEDIFESWWPSDDSVVREWIEPDHDEHEGLSELMLTQRGQRYLVTITPEDGWLDTP